LARSLQDHDVFHLRTLGGVEWVRREFRRGFGGHPCCVPIPNQLTIELNDIRLSKSTLGLKPISSIDTVLMEVIIGRWKISRKYDARVELR